MLMLEEAFLNNTFPKNKQSGFTLIELVVMLVLIGILGAVAAPKFLNLQGDAYKANLSALKNSVNTAAALNNAKAILNGYDTVSSEKYPKADSKNNFRRDDVNGDVHFAYGYPDATGNGIIKMLQNNTQFTSDPDAKGEYLYTHRTNDYTRLSIAMRSRHKLGNDAGNCELIYQAPKAVGQAPDIILYTDGC